MFSFSLQTQVQYFCEECAPESEDVRRQNLIFLIIRLSVKKKKKKKKPREKFVRLNPNTSDGSTSITFGSVRVIEVAAKCLFEFMFDKLRRDNLVPGFLIDKAAGEIWSSE